MIFVAVYRKASLCCGHIFWLLLLPLWFWVLLEWNIPYLCIKGIPKLCSNTVINYKNSVFVRIYVPESNKFCSALIVMLFIASLFCTFASHLNVTLPFEKNEVSTQSTPLRKQCHLMDVTCNCMTNSGRKSHTEHSRKWGYEFSIFVSPGEP